MGWTLANEPAGLDLWASDDYLWGSVKILIEQRIGREFRNNLLLYAV